MSSQRHSLVLRWIATAALFLAVGALGSRPLLGESGSTGGHRAKLDRHLQDVKGQASESVRVIVRTAKGKRESVGDRLERRGRQRAGDLASLDAFVAEVTGSDVAELEQDPDVLGVSTDAVVTSFGTSLDGSTGGALLREVLGVESVRWSGDKVGIAVVDSGLERGHDLDGTRTDKFFDLTNGRNRRAFDDYGHGTHVAGLIGGTGKGSVVRRVTRDRNGSLRVREVALFAGLAPRVRILAFKVLNEEGAGYTSQVIDAIDYIVDNRDRLKIDIINLSLGHPILESASTDPLVLAVERASRAGLIVVAAAGNYGRNPDTGAVGYAGVTSPGNAPSAITVGAYDAHGTVSRVDDTIPDYSSRGPTWYNGYAKPDVVAPGSALVSVAAQNSTLFRLYPGRRVKDRDGAPAYFRLSGTSMATAVTSGTIALMLEAAREAHQADPTPNTIKAILQYTALPMPGYDRLTQGAGTLNAVGAIELAEKIDPDVPSGRYWLTESLSGATTVDGVTYEWAHAVIWGNAVIWGSTLDTNRTAWSQAVIWGSAVIWGNAVIWGSNVVWDQPGVWANAVIWGSTTVGVSNGNAVIWGSSDGLAADTIAWQDLSSAP